MQNSFKPPFLWLFFWNVYFVFAFLLKTLLSLYLSIELFLHFSIEISTFSLPLYLNLYFLFTFPLGSLLSLYFSIEISTFSLLLHWNLYFLFTLPLGSLLSLYFSIEISTFSLLFHWNLYFLFIFLLKSLFSLYFSIFYISTGSLLFLVKALPCLYFSIEISTSSLLFYWNLYFLFTFLLGSLPTFALAPHHHALLPPKPRQDRPQRASQTTTFRNPVHSDLLWKHRGSHTSLLSNLHIVPRLPRKLPPLDWATSELVNCDSTTWLRYYWELPLALCHTARRSYRLSVPVNNSDWRSAQLLGVVLESFMNLNTCELPLDYSTSRLPAPHLHQHYIAKSNHTLLPPMSLRRQKSQRKALPRIRRVTRRNRAAPAPQPLRTQRLTPLAFATPCT